MKKVILLEDDNLLSIIQSKMLKSLGYDVIGTSASGEDGLKKIQTLKPDIIVSDQNLIGELKGLDIVETLRKENNNIPVVILSGDTTYEHLKQANNLKNVQPLSKPVKTADLKKSMSIAEKSLN